MRRPWGEIFDTPPSEAVYRQEQSAAKAAYSLVGKTLLLVDDGETNRKLLGLILRRAGASVELAEDGQLALNAVEPGDFDLLFMDMQMRVMDGYTAAKELHARNFDRPVVALTAHAMRGEEEKCLAAGCTSYLCKPADTNIGL